MDSIWSYIFKLLIAVLITHAIFENFSSKHNNEIEEFTTNLVKLNLTTQKVQTITKQVQTYNFPKPYLSIPNNTFYPEILYKAAVNEVFNCAKGEEFCQEQPPIKNLFNDYKRMSQEDYTNNIKNITLHTSVEHSEFTVFNKNSILIQAKNYNGELKTYGGDWWRARLIVGRQPCGKPSKAGFNFLPT